MTERHTWFTAELVERHIRRHALVNACQDGDVALAYDLLHELARDLPDEWWLYEVANFIRRGLTKLNHVKENKRTILRVVRELEEQARQEHGGTLPYGERGRLLDEVREQFDGEPMPERAELLNDLERGPRRAP
jgi:hypothetical protein